MAVTRQVASPPVKKPSMSRKDRLEISWGLFFLSPWFIGFLFFTAIPIVVSLMFAFTNYNPVHPDQMEWVGFRNILLVFNDPVLLKSIQVTLIFVVVALPLALIPPLMAALLVNSQYLFGKNIFRTLIYMPSVIPVVVSVMIWGGIMNTNLGWLNRFLKFAFNVQGPAWFQDEAWVLPAIAIMGLWGMGNTMLTMLAGLQNVPTELYEAATIDGANGLQQFFVITLPMMSPIIFYNLVLAVIGCFQVFTPGYIIGNGRGDPNNATLFYNMYLYRQGWNFHNMGYAATLAWFMFLFVLILTVGLFVWQRRWVYYSGGD